MPTMADDSVRGVPCEALLRDKGRWPRRSPRGAWHLGPRPSFSQPGSWRGLNFESRLLDCYQPCSDQVGSAFEEADAKFYTRRNAVERSASFGDQVGHCVTKDVFQLHKPR